MAAVEFEMMNLHGHSRRRVPDGDRVVVDARGVRLEIDKPTWAWARRVVKRAGKRVDAAAVGHGRPGGRLARVREAALMQAMHRALDECGVQGPLGTSSGVTPGEFMRTLEDATANVAATMAHAAGGKPHKASRPGPKALKAAARVAAGRRDAAGYQPPDVATVKRIGGLAQGHVPRSMYAMPAEKWNAMLVEHLRLVDREVERGGPRAAPVAAAPPAPVALPAAAPRAPADVRLPPPVAGERAPLMAGGG